MNQLYKAYSKATHTVGKTRQVVMLYDGMIRFLNQARDAIEKQDYERRFTSLSRASAIAVGLQSCLDFEAGAAAAQTLYDFYAAIDLRMAQLNRTNDVAECNKIIAELKQMREVWNAIDQGSAAPQPSPSAASDGAEPMPLQQVIVSA